MVTGGNFDELKAWMALEKLKMWKSLKKKKSVLSPANFADKKNVM